MGRVFGDQMFLQKLNVLLGINLNTWTYNCCSIDLEKKVLGLHKLWVLNISLFWLTSR